MTSVTSSDPQITYIDSQNGIIIGDGINPCVSTTFSDILDLTKIFDDDIISINSYAFHSCQLRGIILPDSLVSIGASAFAQSNIQSIVLGPNVKFIGDSCFHLSNITFADFSKTKLTKFEVKYTFSTTKLENILLPETFEEFGHFTFGHSQLKNITLPKSLKNFGDGAFGECKNLKIIKSNSHEFVEYDGVIYSKDFKILYRYPVNGTQIISSTVEEIYGYAFSGVNFVVHTVKARVRTFGKGPFRGCMNVEFIDISNCLITVLPLESFYDCPKLKNIIFPDTLQSIEYNILFGSKIERCVLPPSVNRIDSKAFASANVVYLEYCGLYNLQATIVSTAQIRVNAKYSYDTFLSTTNFRKDLNDCLPARTPFPTPSKSPICYYSIEHYPVTTFNYMIFVSVLIVMEEK